MPYAVTLEIVDAVSPSTKLSGSYISDGTVIGSGYTDGNGQLIYTVIADTAGYLVIISHPGSTPSAPDGFLNKNYNVSKANDGTIQTITLNRAPHTEPGEPIKCFIVSATTGSSESVEVSRLRQLRDRVASASLLGGQLIDVIYRDYSQFSPEIADELEQNGVAQKAVLWVVVRPLLAWYTLAGVLALEQANRKTVDQAARDVLSACPRYLGGSSIIALLETIRAGKALPPDTHPLLLDFAPRIQKAADLRFASWAILDPLVRAWRSATNHLDVIDEVAQWLATAPLEALALPSDRQVLDVELGVLAGFFDFQPIARRQLGERLAATWPDATSALERAGFVSQTLTSQEEQ